MSKRLFIVLLAVIFGLVAVSVFAATAKKTTKSSKKTTKPATKTTKTTTTKPPVKSTARLSGFDNAQFGEEYTLGKEYPVNFILNSAEFTIEPVKIGEILEIPARDEKLLVLNFTVRNPNPREQLFRSDTLNFTVVDVTNMNREYCWYVGEKGTRNSLDMMVKPSQKVEGYTVFHVPAQGVIPKLMVKSQDQQVLRYDLRDKIKLLVPPFCGENGADALEEIPAEIGTAYSLGNWSFKLESAAFSEKSIRNDDDEEYPEDTHFLVLTFSVKNIGTYEHLFRSDTLYHELMTKEEGSIESNQWLLTASRGVPFESNVKPGQEIKARYYFPVAKGVLLDKFIIREQDGHSFAYDMSNLM